MGAPKTLGFLRYFYNRRLKQPLRLSERYHRWVILFVPLGVARKKTANAKAGKTQDAPLPRSLNPNPFPPARGGEGKKGDKGGGGCGGHND